MAIITLKKRLQIEADLAKQAAASSSRDSSAYFNQGKEWAYRQALKLIEEIIG